MMQNEFEYFAVATELYFTATQWDHTMDKLMRYDRLRRRDRGVAEMVEMVSGCGARVCGAPGPHVQPRVPRAHAYDAARVSYAWSCLLVLRLVP